MHRNSHLNISAAQHRESAESFWCNRKHRNNFYSRFPMGRGSAANRIAMILLNDEPYGGTLPPACSGSFGSTSRLRGAHRQRAHPFIRITGIHLEVA